jgi:hypothetical protein
VCRASEIVNGAGFLHGRTGRLLETLGIQGLTAQERFGCSSPYDRWRYGSEGDADLLAYVAVGR